MISDSASGTSGTMKNISKPSLLGLPISLPPIAEQRKITEILSCWDQGIDHFEKLTRKYQSRKRYLLQNLMTTRCRLDGFRSDWKLVCLKSVTSIFDGTHMTPDYQESGIPFYSVEHVTNDDFDNTKFISRSVFETENRRVKIEKGDILMTRIGDIGTPKHVTWDVEASFYVSLALIKHSSHFDSEFLTQYIRSNAFQRELNKRTIHVAFPKKINLGEIGECHVLLPELGEQKQIAAILSEADKAIKASNDAKLLVQSQKQALMQKLLTGKIRVKV